MGIKGYSSDKGYGGIGYRATTKKGHTNEEKALYHGLKAARRWVDNGQYKDAVIIAKSVSECYLQSEGIALPKLSGDKEIEQLKDIKNSMLGEIKTELKTQLRKIKKDVESEKHEKAALDAYKISIYYLKAHELHIEDN